MGVKKITMKELDTLFLNGNYAEYLKYRTRQVRWLYKNSNKCLTVIPQTDVWAVVYKLEQEIQKLRQDGKAT